MPTDAFVNRYFLLRFSLSSICIQSFRSLKLRFLKGGDFSKLRLPFLCGRIKRSVWETVKSSPHFTDVNCCFVHWAYARNHNNSKQFVYILLSRFGLMTTLHLNLVQHVMDEQRHLLLPMFFLHLNICSLKSAKNDYLGSQLVEPADGGTLSKVGMFLMRSGRKNSACPKHHFYVWVSPIHP